VDRGLIRILDLLFLKKANDGSFEAYESSDLDDAEVGDLRGYETALAMVLSEQDVTDLAETIEPGSTAAVLVWPAGRSEHRCRPTPAAPAERPCAAPARPPSR
jgi:hypothetical protein